MEVGFGHGIRIMYEEILGKKVVERKLSGAYIQLMQAYEAMINIARCTLVRKVKPI